MKGRSHEGKDVILSSQQPHTPTPPILPFRVLCGFQRLRVLSYALVSASVFYKMMRTLAKSEGDVYHVGMKVSLIIALLLVMATGAYSANDVSVSNLPNGMSVIVKEGHAVNLVALDIWVKAGSVHETAANNGISHFCEHMVFKATKKYGPGEIDREMEGVGAEVNGGTSKDYVHFYTTVASEYLPTALNVLADAMMNAQFRQEDMDKERQVVLDEIARTESDPVRRAVAIFAGAAYTAHPYGLASVGTRDTVLKLKRDELLSYYTKYFTPANTCVSIAGDVSKDAAIEAIKKAFTGFESAHPNSTVVESGPPAEPAHKTPIVRKYSWQQSANSFVILGFPAARASEVKDVCALDSILEIFGNTTRGRISAALTDAKIKCYQISADFVTQRYPGLFYVLVSVDPADEEKAAGVLLKEYTKIALGPIDAGELADAKSRVVGNELYDFETVSGQARILGMYATIGSYDQTLALTPEINKLTTSDVISAAQKYFSGSNYTLVVIEPAAAK